MSDPIDQLWKESMQAADDMWWTRLSDEEQLRCFRQVCKLIHKGDIEDRGSYRYVLYDVFGWGPEAYGDGLEHYMKIHNLISYGLEKAGPAGTENLP
jgi:hypothetical protein